MDWNLAIERNREALKRIVAMLVAMAGLGNGHSAIAGRQSESEPAQAADGPATPDCQLPTADCRVLLPRHLHRAVLRLLRPAESAARRLVIVMARGLVVALAGDAPAQGKTGVDFPAQARRHRHSYPGERPRFGVPLPLVGRGTGWGCDRAPAVPLVVRPAQAVSPQAEAARRERHSPHLVSRRHRAVSRYAAPSARARRSARRDPPRAPPPGAGRGAGRPAATRKALRALEGCPRRRRRRKKKPAMPQARKAENSTPAAFAASGRCVRAVRPANVPPIDARTRCTKSCTTSTASPSTSWSIPTRRDRP